ncbi:permease-like cell division protein FtsX [Oscillatoria amoena NRMC-F 0135]|nr:permease-like cell division protein FtsX [Oscillatoria amoena NRMC-F 0135]
MQKGTGKKKLGSYPLVGVIFSITLALFVTGLFGILIIYSTQLEKIVRENVRMQVYLKNGLTESQRNQVEKKLEALPYINKPSNGLNPVIRFVSKEDAAKQFIAETGEDFTKFLGENPLHDAFLVTVAPDYHNKESLDKIKKEIEAMNGIFQVFYVEELIASINKNVTRISLILLGLITIFMVVVVLLINNTIRLALFSQRFLIRSMQLVGAKNWFIQKPFLSRAIVYGIIGGLLASIALAGLIEYANHKIEDLRSLLNIPLLLILMGTLLLLGVIVSVISTQISIRRYLRMSLDDLY